MRFGRAFTSARAVGLAFTLTLGLPGAVAEDSADPVPEEVRDAVFAIEDARETSVMKLLAFEEEARALYEALSAQAEADYDKIREAVIDEFRILAESARAEYIAEKQAAEEACGDAHEPDTPEWDACMRDALEEARAEARAEYEDARAAAKATLADAAAERDAARAAAREAALASYRERVDALRDTYEARVQDARDTFSVHGVTEAAARRALWERGDVPDAPMDPAARAHLEDAASRAQPDATVPDGAPMAPVNESGTGLASARRDDACARLLAEGVAALYVEDLEETLTREGCADRLGVAPDANADTGTVTRTMYEDACTALIDSGNASLEVAWLPHALSLDACRAFLGVTDTVDDAGGDAVLNESVEVSL